MWSKVGLLRHLFGSIECVNFYETLLFVYSTFLALFTKQAYQVDRSVPNCIISGVFTEKKWRQQCYILHYTLDVLYPIYRRSNQGLDNIQWWSCWNSNKDSTWISTCLHHPQCMNSPNNNQQIYFDIIWFESKGSRPALQSILVRKKVDDARASTMNNCGIPKIMTCLHQRKYVSQGTLTVKQVHTEI